MLTYFSSEFYNEFQLGLDKIGTEYLFQDNISGNKQLPVPMMT